MGNGLPLSAAAASRQIVEDYRARSRYFNTFASSPLQAATGMAVLQEIEDQQILSRVQDVGQYLREGLDSYLDRVSALGDIRSQGLFIGLEWVIDKENNEPDQAGAIKVVNLMKEKGFLMSNAGEHSNVVKIRPPLVFQREHADLFLDAFDSVMEEHFV